MRHSKPSLVLLGVLMHSAALWGTLMCFRCLWYKHMNTGPIEHVSISSHTEHVYLVAVFCVVGQFDKSQFKLYVSAKGSMLKDCLDYRPIHPKIVYSFYTGLNIRITIKNLLN